MKEEKILDRIAGLLAKSKGTDSLEEAQTFMAKAQEMLFKYNLTETDVDGHTAKKELKMSDIEIKWGNVKSDGDWEMRLWDIVSHYNMCRFIYNRYYKTGTVVGELQNVEMTVYVAKFATTYLKSASSKTWNDTRKQFVSKSRISSSNDTIDAIGKILLIASLSSYGYNKHPDELKRTIVNRLTVDKDGCWIIKNPEGIFLPYRKVWIRNFLKGAVLGIKSALENQRIQQYKSDGRTTGLIVLHEKLVDEHTAKLFPNVKTVKERKIIRGQGFQEGVQAGKNLKVNQGVNAAPVTDKSKLLR